MRLTDGQKISLTLMVTALELVMLYAAGMFGIGGYALLAIASVFTYVLTAEDLYIHAVVSYIAVTAIAFLVVPDKVTPLVFAGLIGHYPLFKAAIDKHSGNKLAAFCIKLLYCNLFLIAALCIVRFIFHISIPTDIPVPKWLVIIGVEAALTVTELLHTFAKWLYTEKLRSGMVPRN